MSFCPILKREVKFYFSSWTVYIILSLFSIMSGYFFYTNLIFFVLWAGVNLQIDMWQFFFHDIRLIMLLTIPLLTMRLFAEEKKSGTIELIFTLPLKDGEVLLGKFVACVLMFVIMLGLTLPYPLLLSLIHRVDMGPVAVGYLGVFLLGCTFVSVGVFVSSLTENQIVSAFVSFIILLFFWLIAWNEGIGGDTLVKILLRISLFDHFYSFARGVIETKDIAFNLFLTLFFLFLTLKSLESRKWRGIR